MKLGLGMFNQLRRLWTDDGSNDKDFTGQEQKLNDALIHLREAANSLSRASDVLIEVIRTKGA